MVLDHICLNHNVVVRRDEDFDGFRCEECDVYLNKIIPFLVHMDKTHGVHIWYERGLTNKRVFFDGTLRQPAEDIETERKEQANIQGANVPISKRPYKPRRTEYTDDEDQP